MPITSMENSDMLTLKGVAGQNGNANNSCCICGAMPNAVLTTVQL